MQETKDSIEEKISEVFRKLSLQRQEQVLDFVEFLIWKEQRQNINNDEMKEN